MKHKYSTLLGIISIISGDCLASETTTPPMNHQEKLERELKSPTSRLYSGPGGLPADVAGLVIDYTTECPLLLPDNFLMQNTKVLIAESVRKGDYIPVGAANPLQNAKLDSIRDVNRMIRGITGTPKGTIAYDDPEGYSLYLNATYTGAFENLDLTKLTPIPHSAYWSVEPKYKIYSASDVMRLLGVTGLKGHLERRNNTYGGGQREVCVYQLFIPGKGGFSFIADFGRTTKNKNTAAKSEVSAGGATQPTR